MENKGVHEFEPEIHKLLLADNTQAYLIKVPDDIEITFKDNELSFSHLDEDRAFLGKVLTHKKTDHKGTVKMATQYCDFKVPTGWVEKPEGQHTLYVDYENEHNTYTNPDHSFCSYLAACLSDEVTLKGDYMLIIEK
jgi:hypothetical protein